MNHRALRLGWTTPNHHITRLGCNRLAGLLCDNEQFSIDGAAIGSKVRFSMTVGANSDAVMHPITCRDSKDVMHVEKCCESAALPTRGPLTLTLGSL